MGYLRGTMCYETYSDWQDATLGAIPPIYTPGSTSYEVFYKKDPSLGWQVCRSQLSSTAVRSGLSCGAVPMSSTGIAQCSPELAVVDGAVLGFAVSLSVIIAWGALLMARWLR